MGTVHPLCKAFSLSQYHKDEIVELHVLDTCLYHVFRFFGNDNFFVIFVKVKLIIKWIYIRYRRFQNPSDQAHQLPSFKSSRKVAGRENVILIVNVSDMFEWILNWKSAMTILKLIVCKNCRDSCLQLLWP